MLLDFLGTITAADKVIRLFRDLGKDRRQTAPASKAASGPVPAVPHSEPDAEHACAVEIGRRHRHVRELMGLSLAEGARFYRMERMSQLERCERGEDELTLAQLDAFERFFFVSQEFLREGTGWKFETFDLSRWDIFLGEGFKPYVLGCPDKNSSRLPARLAFLKTDDRFRRFACSALTADFASIGGGKQVAMCLISAMVRRGRPWWDAEIRTVDEKTWIALSEGQFYWRGGVLGAPSAEYEDVFIEWHNESHARHVEAWHAEEEEAERTKARPQASDRSAGPSS